MVVEHCGLKCDPLKLVANQRQPTESAEYVPLSRSLRSPAQPPLPHPCVLFCAGAWGSLFFVSWLNGESARHGTSVHDWILQKLSTLQL